MKNKISLKEIEILFEYSKKIYSNSIDREDAKIELAKKGINKRTSECHIQAYSKMLKGELFTQTINIEATCFFIDEILKTNGISAYNNALNSLSFHIDYYEKKQKYNVIKKKIILEKYRREIIIETSHYFNDELKTQDEFPEGTLKQIYINAYERNSKARSNCIEHYGATCQVCNFNFEKTYGELGSGFIHIHHIVDISTIKKEYNVDPIKDLVPVCPNCHAMLHKKKPAYSIEKLRSIITGEK